MLGGEWAGYAELGIVVHNADKCVEKWDSCVNFGSESNGERRVRM